MISLAILRRLHLDAKMAEAAGRDERVDLQYLMKKHVPLDLRTERLTDELPIAKESIAHRLRYWRRILAGLAALVVITGAPTAYGVRLLLTSARMPDKAVVALDIDPAAAIRGVWGAKFDFERSCSQNPHTIAIADGGHRLTYTYKKPLNAQGPAPFNKMDFDVVGRKGNTLILAYPSPEDQRNERGELIRIQIVFDDNNTYHLMRSDRPMALPGAIVRCTIEEIAKPD
jgi:hypothetical protein